MSNVYILIFGAVLGSVTTMMILGAFGLERVAHFAVKIADVLESAHGPAAGDVRPQVVAALMADGYTVDEANDAVSESARGPRSLHAWRRRAIRVLQSGI